MTAIMDAPRCYSVVGSLDDDNASQAPATRAWRFLSRQGRPLLDGPRTDPGGHDSRTGFPPRVFDGKADLGPGMKDSREWQEGHHQPRNSLPGRAALQTK